MSGQTDMRLIYEWNAKCAQLDLAIAAAERQLASVRKRKRRLWQGFWVYVALATVPVLLFHLLNLVPYNKSVLYIFTVDLFRFALKGVYLILLPFNIYYLLYNGILLKLNHDSRGYNIEKLPLERELRGRQPEREASYQLEEKKLLFALNRYYLNRGMLAELRRRMDSETEAMTIADLKAELNKLPIYGEIRPANPAVGSLPDKARRITAVIIIILIAAVGLPRIL